MLGADFEADVLALDALEHLREDLRILDVLRVGEDCSGEAALPCLQPEGRLCRITPSCRLRTAMQEAQRAFLAALDEYTLADLVAKKKPLRELLQIVDGVGRPVSSKAERRSVRSV